MPDTFPSVLIIRLDAMGDALTLVPLLAALRARGARIGAVLRAPNAGILSQRALDRRHLAGVHVGALAAELRARRYEHALIATEKPEGYRIAAKAGIPHRTGFENGWGKPLKTLWIRHLCTSTVHRTAGLDSRAPHECEVLFLLAQELLPNEHPVRDPSVLRPFVLDDEPPPDERVAFQVTQKWGRLGARLEDVVEAARALQNALPTRFLAAASERAYAQRFAAQSGFAVEAFDDVAAWKAAIASARALLAPDSGATHVAGMCGTPVAALFPARDFALQSARWAPWAAPSALLPLVPGWPQAAANAVIELAARTPAERTT